MCFFMQCPSKAGCQILGMGEHWPHVNATATPKDRLTVSMMVQTKRRIQLSWEMRRTVMAKEVLDHKAARMEKVPAMLVRSR